MLRIKIAFFLIGGFFIAGSVFAQNEFLQENAEVTDEPALFESNQEPMDFEDVGEDEMGEEQALEEEEMIEPEEISGEEVPKEELIQDEMVEEETDLQEGNKGYVYYSSTEQKLEKERKEGISPWRLIKKLDDWIKKNLW